MKYSQLFAKTIKKDPKDEVSINAKYLMRAGFIDKLMAGSFTLLPLGLRVKQKIEQIVREEMNKTGAQEILMPLLHPKDIWNETGRWDSAKEVMYKLKKDEKEFALSFTHEEIVMDLIRKHIISYKDLPVLLYHFSTKFRDELRAKSGILRGREFLMKDLYSAHRSEEEMQKYYWKVADAYLEVFKRLGLTAIITEASGGVFTDNHTHEFQIENPVGEDTIYMAEGWMYAKNEEVMTEEDRKAKNIRSIKAIEAGNIFQFGTKKYADKMGGVFTDHDGTKKQVWFASYGIGITRLMGILVEVFHDARGIKWPKTAAPYDVHLITLGEKHHQKAEELIKVLEKESKEVLWDDREDVSAGEKFADCDLIGIPTRLVISDKTGDKIEMKKRGEDTIDLFDTNELVNNIS